MAGWIRLRKDLSSDPSVLLMANKLAASHVTNRDERDASRMHALHVTRIIGALASLWIYADEHIREDDTLSVTAEEFDASVGFEFCALMPARWLVITDDNYLKLPKYREAQGCHETRDESGAERSRRYRERKRDAESRVTGNTSRDVSVTSHLQTRQDLEKKESTNVLSKESTARTSHGTRLASDWQPDEVAKQYAAELGIDVARTVLDFREHWHAAAGAKGRKADWPATWRTWCRRAADDRRNRGGSATASARPARPTQESALAALRAAVAAQPDDGLIELQSELDGLAIIEDNQ